MNDGVADGPDMLQHYVEMFGRQAQRAMAVLARALAPVVEHGTAIVVERERRRQGRYRYGYRHTRRGRVPILTPTMIVRQRALRRKRRPR